MAVLILYSAILSLIIEFANAQDWVGDTILPLFPGEVDYHPGLRATFYFIGMVWFFLGIAIAADKFMEAISVITSKTKKIYVNGEEIDVVVWNETVANLTLMALGSSAPEILLATIETVALGFEAGELGPGTIVGSAAFNLLVIISICVVFVPNEDLLDKDKETGTRAIKEMGVFAITASFSIFAYIWLFIVLTVTSPDEIELWEALMTLVFFPLLVLMAYMQDKKLFQQCRRGTRTSNKSLVTNRTLQGKVIDARMGSRPDQALIDAMRNEETHILSNEVVSHLAARHVLQNVRHNRLSYRLQASRAVTGRKNLMPSAENTNEESHKKIVNVGFTAGHYSVMENEGKIVLHVKRDGDQIDECTVEYHTQDGTAIAGKEYEAASGTLKFSSMKETQTITINIIDNEEPQPDRVFQVVLSEPQFVKQQASDYFRLSLKTDHAQVTIVDDDHPGIFQFTQPTFAATPQEPEVSILVKRTNGAKGHIDIEYQTREGNAEVDIDYINSHGTLSFEPGEAEKSINIPILPNARFEKDLTFSIDLLLPKDPNVQLGRLSSVTVTLTNDENFKNIVDKFAEMLKDQEDALRIGSETWGEQFTQAMSLPEPEEGEELTRMDYVLHALSFYWKIILAVIPPTSYWSGWATFLVSLVMIGIITALVGDLAGMFGCCIGISKPVTAITFIALGTSIPDTFASKLAATSDPHADAAIGNVTGSNSVNVFLGLGFPWTLAAIYHAANGTTYEVPAGSLAFSVAVFTICALICLALLVIKRKLMGAELGGKGFWRYGLGIILAALWFIYVLLSSLENYGHIF